MSYFDFDDRYLDDEVVGHAISRRESVFLSIVLHSVVLLAIIFAPRLAFFQPSEEELRQAELERQRQDQTFVFVRPRADLQAQRPPDIADPSDEDRISQAPVVPPEPTNPLPYSRGDSNDRVEESQVARGEPEATPSTGTTPEPTRPIPQADNGFTRPREAARSAPGGSALSDALRNLQRYVQDGSFNNPQGGANHPGATIQFDTKGVEFGPWIRRFVAQVKRNWFVPEAAWLLRGHVVLQFNIHKDGHITDIAVVGPSATDAFNNAAYNAILTSNPTEPLPPEYPTDKALFTVTFYYNEIPPGY